MNYTINKYLRKNYLKVMVVICVIITVGYFIFMGNLLTSEGFNEFCDTKATDIKLGHILLIAIIHALLNRK